MLFWRRNERGKKGGEELQCEVDEWWAEGEEEKIKEEWVEVIKEDPWTRGWEPLKGRQKRVKAKRSS